MHLWQPEFNLIREYRNCDNACVSYTGLCAATVGRDPVVPIVIEIRVVDSSRGSWYAIFGGVCVTSVGLFCVKY